MRRLASRPGWHLEQRTLWVAVLLLLALLGIGLAVADVVRGFDGGLAWLVVIVALLLGWWLATSSLTAWQAFLALSLAGASVVLLRVARLGQMLWDVIRALGAAAWAGLHPAPDPVSPSETISQAFLRLTGGLGALASRIADWLQTLLGGESAYDPLAAALVWSLLLWGTAAWAAWATRRRDRPLQGMIPAVALGGVAIRYAGASWGFFLVPLAATLMLMAFAGHDSRNRRWATLGVGTPEGLGTTLAQSAVPIALGLVVLGALTPSLSVQEAARFLQRLRSEPETPQDRVASSLGLDVQPPSGSALQNPQAPGLPNRHLIGSGPELADNVVMIPILTGLPFEVPTPDYYWRGLTYDRYFGRGWGTSPTVTWEYRAGDPTTSEVPPSHRVVRQRIQTQADLGGLVYVTGTLAVLDQEYEVAWRSAPLDPLGASVVSSDYEAESLVAIADPAELSSAGSNYPDWIQSRYLDLPEDLPDRVVALARDLTATAATPYHRAVALETYLRGFPYNLDVPAPPVERDVADWFLFDLKEGYCDYYATAMAVLARAAGLPARMVVGFYTGTAERSEGVIRYIVTEAESHSWVEIYFPGRGWVEFEPTAGRPAIVRSVATDSAPAPGAAHLEIADATAAARWEGLVSNAQRTGGALVLLASTTAAVWILWDRWHLGRLSPRAAVGLLYGRLYRRGRWLRLPLSPGTTPHEFSAALAKRVNSLQLPGRRAGTARRTLEEARLLTLLYARTAYGPEAPSREEIRWAVRLWPWMHLRLWLTRILAAWGERRRRPSVRTP